MFPIRILRRAGRGEMQFSFTSIEAVFALPSAAAGAVHQVAEERVEMSAASIDESLRTGALRSTDLIELDGAWVALADAIPFLEAAEVAQRRERRVAFVKASLLALLSLCLTAGYFMLRMWLARRRA
ncbi:MAG: hypothetical protein ABTQ32_20010 [Myxococcaceae bacterium]